MLQTILIPKKYFTENQAMNWLYRNGFTAKKIDITQNYYRFRQSPPNPRKHYYTVSLDDGVKLVLQD